MKVNTMGQVLNFNDDYVKNHGEKCAKIKTELVRIEKDYKAGKAPSPDKLKNHPIITEPFEYPTRYGRDGKYELIFNDCLPGKAWVRAHYTDTIPEPSIELRINGKAYHFNGNYKAGVIKQTMKLV